MRTRERILPNGQIALEIVDFSDDEDVAPDHDPQPVTITTDLVPDYYNGGYNERNG